MKSLLEDTAFLEALRVASADLYDECIKWKAGGISEPRKIKKLTHTLSKYYNRMRSRPTPFGAFSGFSLLDWAAETAVTVAAEQWQRNIRLDMDFLCTLAQHLQQDTVVCRYLHYQVNTSLYKLGEEYRYYETYFEQLKKKYQISAITSSPLLEMLLPACRQQGSMSFQQLVTFICEKEAVAAQEAAGFALTLIEHQVLVSNLTVQITGKDYLQQIIAALQPVPESHTTTGQLIKLLHRIAEVCETLPGGLLTTIQKITELVAATGLPHDANKLIQVDTVAKLVNNTVQKDMQQDLAEAVNVLHTLCSGRKESPWMKNFKEQFAARFETRPVQLVQAIDPDTGIPDANNPDYIDYNDPALNKLNSFNAVTNSTSRVIQDDPVRKLLSGKLLQAYKQDDYIIQITPAELEQIRSQQTALPLPDTFHILFQRVQTADASIYIESAGGFTGTSLLGRFARAEDEVHQLLREITEFEQTNHCGQVLADIVHLPEDRIGNVLLHPATRRYEIPYLAQASVNTPYQISIEDLYLRMDKNKLQLHSLSLGQQVLPRIDNAHNCEYRTLPLYRLLGSIQGEDHQHPLSFHWNVNLPGIYFLPRVQYKHIILSIAEWNLPAEKCNKMLSLPETQQQEAFIAFAQQWKLPRFFTLVDGDMTLLVDQEDPITIQTFLSEIRQRTIITLREHIHTDDTVRDSTGQVHSHQLVAIVRNDTNVRPIKAEGTILTDVTRDFPPGSEWAYYKLYCNTGKANDILCEWLLPLITKLIQARHIDHWFFIRYDDPQPHLRVRFHLRDISFAGTLEQLLYEQLAPAFDNQVIWKIQADTYNREIERYGATTIQEAEELFGVDSRYVVQLTQLLHAYPQRSTLLLLSALKYIDDLMEMCELPLSTKCEWTLSLQESFDREFNTGKEEKEILNQYFRNHSADLRKWLQRGQEINDEPEIAALLQWKLDNMQPVLSYIWHYSAAGAKKQLLASLIHMHFNRLFPAGQRRYEMIAYNLLSKYYKSQLARSLAVH